MKSSSEKMSGERGSRWLEMKEAERSDTDQTISSSDELSSERLSKESSELSARSSACIAFGDAMKLKEDASDDGERTREVAPELGAVAMAVRNLLELSGWRRRRRIDIGHGLE